MSEEPCGKCNRRRWWVKGSKTLCIGCDPPLKEKSVVVQLTPQQEIWANVEAKARQKRNEKAGNWNRYKLPTGMALEAHTLGVLGELVYAIYSGLPWAPGPEHDTEQGDVFGVQVRTRGKPHYDLYLWPKDPMKFPYVLVVPTGKRGQYRLVGWQWGWYAQQPAFKQQLPGTRIEAYWVPQDQLRPMFELDPILTLEDL